MCCACVCVLDKAIRVCYIVSRGARECEQEARSGPGLSMTDLGEDELLEI
jgi:hypothetical protein